MRLLASSVLMTLEVRFVSLDNIGGGATLARRRAKLGVMLTFFDCFFPPALDRMDALVLSLSTPIERIHMTSTTAIPVAKIARVEEFMDTRSY